MFLLAFLGPAAMGSINYVYNEYHAAFYAALGPIGWCGLFSWIVFTSHLGYTSKHIHFGKKIHLKIIVNLFRYRHSK